MAPRRRPGRRSRDHDRKLTLRELQQRLDRVGLPVTFGHLDTDGAVEPGLDDGATVSCAIDGETIDGETVTAVRFRNPATEPAPLPEPIEDLLAGFDLEACDY
ncbi:MAG: hypothetical protein ACOCZK_00765 [Planctomycetota bacterium]